MRIESNGNGYYAVYQEIISMESCQCSHGSFLSDFGKNMVGFRRIQKKLFETYIICGITRMGIYRRYQ